MSAITITGTLLRPAHAATGVDGTAWVDVEIGQGNRSVACRARQRLGQGNGAQFAAANMARRLRTGARVRIHAAGYTIEARPTPHLVLHGVDFIESLALPVAHHTPEAVEVEMHP